MSKVNEHADALRKLGRTLPKEQMFVLFDAANEISRLEGKYATDIKNLEKREQHWWNEHNVQMKRADELQQQLDNL